MDAPTLPPRYDYGAEVRVVRTLRNDGTFPGCRTGELLVRRGSLGYVRDVGTFLQDQVVYAVDFLDAGRVVGCRAEELIPGDAPWIPSRYEFRDKVTPRFALALGGAVVARPGDRGEVLKVLRDAPGGVACHVRINDHTVQVAEDDLDPAAPLPETDHVS